MPPSTTAPSSQVNSSAQQPIYHPTPSSTVTTTNGSNTATMRRPQYPSPNAQQKQPHYQKQNSIETIPNCNSIDSAMFERDKQIYKCSTLRQGGKWDPKYKPSILNCPLPEIPKEANESPKKEDEKESQPSNYSKTLQRPPMKLPPTVKAIPPPKIDSLASPPRSLSNVLNGNSPVVVKNNETDSQIKSPIPQQQNQQQQQPVQSPKSTTDTPINSTTVTTTPNGNQQIQSPQESRENVETTINPNDESNYAVTEL